MTAQFYGYFSAKMSYRCGYSIYEGQDGKPVQVTCVTPTKGAHQLQWDDVVYVGPVTKWLSTQGPSFQDFGDLQGFPKTKTRPQAPATQAPACTCPSLLFW